jgi:hypothetical protein
MVNLCAPGLSELHFSLGDILIALRCGRWFAAAMRMRMISTHQDKALVRELYAMTPAVTSLAEGWTKAETLQLRNPKVESIKSILSILSVVKKYPDSKLRYS